MCGGSEPVGGTGDPQGCNHTPASLAVAQVSRPVRVTQLSYGTCQRPGVGLLNLGLALGEDVLGGWVLLYPPPGPSVHWLRPVPGPGRAPGCPGLAADGPETSGLQVPRNRCPALASVGSWAGRGSGGQLGSWKLLENKERGTVLGKD